MNDLGRIEDLPQAYRDRADAKQFGALVAKFAGRLATENTQPANPAHALGLPRHQTTAAASWRVDAHRKGGAPGARAGQPRPHA